ncbi:MAG: glucose-6-phosphate isomerase [Deltaproteobacteria bacterium]|nr:glucose-6-phosphate isomerase [Deltaproteobacteria bacterium]
MDAQALWARYTRQLYSNEDLGLTLDPSRMDLDEAWLEGMKPSLARAFEAMEALEGGAIANPDEGRKVGHYWLRDPSRAPDPETREAIEGTLKAIQQFVGDVRDGTVAPEGGETFSQVLVVGIGGSALGPQFVAHALGSAEDPMRPFFVDNTDPDGMDKVLGAIARGEGLERTLTVVISKSGGTKETRNGMLEVAQAYGRLGLSFARHAVAVTGDGSELDRHAKKEGWITTFPMWDWVGGRTSELSAVGLLPAALQGIDITAMLDGARAMDTETRKGSLAENPAAWLALAWHHAGGGKGGRDMVLLPYKDRLELFSRYLQQLVMESLGKERDLQGNVVHQGIAVYGNKGSTDQHAYVQQLRDGVHNFFVTFLEVLRDREGPSLEVDPGVTAGDYLYGFLEGTRRALYESGRQSVTITVREVSPRVVGMLIALYERAVGLYASLVGINAYHQPGVEAGKKAAGAVIALQARALAALRAEGGAWRTPAELADKCGDADVETVYRILRHASANGDHGVDGEATLTPARARFRAR